MTNQNSRAPRFAVWSVFVLLPMVMALGVLAIMRDGTFGDLPVYAYPIVGSVLAVVVVAIAAFMFRVFLGDLAPGANSRTKTCNGSAS